MLWLLAAVTILFPSFQSLRINYKSKNTAYSALFSTVGDSQPLRSWQQDVDEILDIDTDCTLRREKAIGLINKANEIRDDVINAIQDNDIKKVAPSNLKYGKAVAGIQTFQRQLFNDIFPDLLSKGIPKAIELGPQLLNDLVKSLPETSKEIISAVREISQDPSALQSTVDDLRKEARNVFLTTPEGLYTPEYITLKQTDAYEIRSYSPYSVCSTQVKSVEVSNDQEITDPITSGTSFNILASYLFGKNSRKEKLSMTTPVIMEKNIMEFVLPMGFSSENAPTPDNENVQVKDIPSEIIAAREFTGIPTEGEVSRQRAFLEDSLLSDGIMYDNLSFKVLQYNPPYTLPWLRRNEVTVKVFYQTPPVAADIESSEPVNLSNNGDAGSFFTSPEAGD